MAVQLEHAFTMSKPIDESFAAITDLELVVPCVEGGQVLERTGDDSVNAEIVVKMGAMSMKFTGTVEVTEKDAEAHRAVLTEPITHAHGIVRVPDAPGLGIEIDREVLRRFRI